MSEFMVAGTAMGQFYNDISEVVGVTSGTWAAGRGSVLSQKETDTGMLLEMEHVFSTSQGGVVRTKDRVELTKIEGKENTFMLELTYKVVETFGHLSDYKGSFNSLGLINLVTGEAFVRFNGGLSR